MSRDVVDANKIDDTFQNFPFTHCRFRNKYLCERIHIDFAGPYAFVIYWLVLCDALLKSIELKPMGNMTTENILDDIFCTLGLPQIVAPDNGPQFTSLEFKEHYKSHGILHIKLSPYRSRKNGLVEWLVRTFKT